MEHFVTSRYFNTTYIPAPNFTPRTLAKSSFRYRAHLVHMYNYHRTNSTFFKREISRDVFILFSVFYWSLMIVKKPFQTWRNEKNSGENAVYCTMLATMVGWLRIFFLLKLPKNAKNTLHLWKWIMWILNINIERCCLESILQLSKLSSWLVVWSSYTVFSVLMMKFNISVNFR